MRSYQNAERGLQRVNTQMDKNNRLSGIFSSRWVMIGGAVTAAAPLITRLAGAATQLVGSLVQAAGGAGVIGGGAIGAFAVGLGSVMLVMKGVTTEIKNAQTAYTRYNTTVQEFGAQSRQAVTAQRNLNEAIRQAPRGTLTLLQNVKALGNEWRSATARARDYIVQTANYAVARARQNVPQIGGIVNRNVGAVAGGARTIIDRLLSPESIALLERVSVTFRRDLPPAADAAANLAMSFGRLVADAGPFVRQFLVSFDRWTQRLDVATRDTGYITFRMREMVTEFRNWEHFLISTGRLLITLFRAATVTHTSLKGITATFDDWTRWMQNNPLRMQRFFQNSAQATHDLGAALMFVLHLIAQLSTGLDPLWQSIRQIIGAFGAPLLALLHQVIITIGLLSTGIGGIGGPLAILLRVFTHLLTVVNVLLTHVPLLGVVLAGALTVVGLVRMVTWMGRFVGLIPRGTSEMAQLTAAINGATAATGRLAVAESAASGAGIGALGVGGRVSRGGVILPASVGSVATAGEEAVAGTAARTGLLGRLGRIPLIARLGGSGGGLGGLAGLGRSLGTLRGGLGAAGIATLIATTALPMLGVGGRVGGVLSNIGTGASLGAAAGSFIPGVGTGIGALVGGIGGGIYSAFHPPAAGDPRLTQYERAVAGYDTTVGGHRGVTGHVMAGRAGMLPTYGTVGGTTVHHAGLSAQLGRFGGDSAHTAAQISAQLRILRNLRGTLAGDRSPGAQSALSSLNSLIQTRQSVLPGVRAQERHAQFTGAFNLQTQLGQGYNVVNQAQGPQAAMEFVRRQALARWAQLGPEGRRVLAQGLVSWADQMRRANPALAGQFDALKKSVIGKFVEVRGSIHLVHGQILEGTRTEWQRIRAAMETPVEQAREMVNANFTLIQQKAVGSLTAMGMTPAAARRLVQSAEGSGGGVVGYGALPTQNPVLAEKGGWTGLGPRGGPGGGGAQNSRGGLHAGVRHLAADVLGRFPALSITSGLRANDTGSYHSRGMAVDLAGPGMGSAARWIASQFGGSLLEGIHNTGLSVKNGQMVDPSFWGASTWAAHQNHIHLAVGDAFGGGGGGARGSMTGGLAGRVTLGQLSPGLSGLRALPGLLTDSTGLLVAGATAHAVNARIRARGARSAVRGAVATSNTQALGQQMAAQRGWTGGQWSALRTLWMGESGWDPRARNPSSGAFGIPQALPPSKMGAAATGGDASAQIAWGLSYIAGRYGTPSRALASWQARSPHWYGDGGRFVARRPQVIGVGDKQDEMVTVTPVGHGARNGRRGGLGTGTGGGLHVTVHIARIDATGKPGQIREMVRGEIRDAIADVAAELDRTGFAADEELL